MEEKYSQYHKQIHDIFSRYNTEDILSSLLELQLFSEVGKKDDIKMQKAEWLAGNLVKYNITNSKEIYKFSTFSNIEGVAEEAILSKVVFDAFENIEEKINATDIEKQDYLTSIFMKSKNQLHRGDGYIKQLIIFAEKLYSKFDSEFYDELGFTYTSCQKLFIYVYQQYYFNLVQLFKEKFKLGYMLKSFINTIVKKKPLINQSIQSGYVFRVYKKDLYDLLGEKEVEAIIRELGLNLGDKNIRYKDIGDFNPLCKKPIISFEDYIYVPLPILTLQNLPKIFHYYFIADKRFKAITRAEYKKHRGDTIEELAALYLGRLFKQNSLYQSLKYDIDKEADLTVQEEDITVFCECKSKVLTLSSLQGNIESIKDDFNKAIGESFNQALRTKRWINDNKEFMVKQPCEDKTSLVLNNTSKKYIVCIVAEHFGWISSDIKKFLQPDEGDGLLPIVTNIFDLDIITQECANKDEYISYLQSRLENFDKISSSDELECFAILKQQHFKNIDFNADSISPIGYTYELDKKYTTQDMKWLLDYK